jgi:hypothetical protein
MRTLNLPRPTRVRTGAGGVPLEVDGHAVEQVRESWLVEDRWWSARPLRRRYWEVLSASGRNLVVFHELGAGGAHAPGGGSARGGEPPRGRDGAHGAWFLQGP